MTLASNRPIRDPNVTRFHLHNADFHIDPLWQEVGEPEPVPAEPRTSLSRASWALIIAAVIAAWVGVVIKSDELGHADASAGIVWVAVR